MNPIALDTETTTYSKGNCYDSRNELVCWSWANANGAGASQWYECEEDFVQEKINSSDLVIGFNFKFDVAWLRKMGVDFEGVKVWDCQIAEFIISHQLLKFPSLNDTCVRYSVPTKLDVVKTEYWDKGLDTRDVPWPILREYAAHDAAVTLQVYHKQLEVMSPAQTKLCKLMSQDMLVLQEMEQNGIIYDEELCLERSEEMGVETEKLKQKLSAFYPNIPINFNSGDDLSSFLYGGTIVETIKVHDGFYKTGAKKGLPKMKNTTVEHHLPALFTPIKGTALAKEGYYETNEGCLKKLTGKNKPVVAVLLDLARHEKINGTYYKGLPKLNEEMHWSKGKLHGQLNQTLAVSGRLSSSKPNQQNFATEIQDIFVSEYK